MKFINIVTGEYPVSDKVIRDTHPNTCFPLYMSGVNLEDFGYALVNKTPTTEHDSSTKKVVEDSPIDIDGVYYQTWLVVDKTPEEIQAGINSTIARYTSTLDAFIDAEARKDKWDSRITCVARAGYPNQWQNKAIAFGLWMDTCYAITYQVMADVSSGEISLPTIGEFLAIMPKMEWPE